MQSFTTTLNRSQPTIYPLTEQIWAAMKRKTWYSHHDPSRKNKILTLAETNKVRTHHLDINNPEAVQQRLMFHFNVMGSCRPRTMQRLNYLYCKSWDIDLFGQKRKRASAQAVIIKNNQHGVLEIQEENDQIFRLTCLCPPGNHQPTNCSCPVACFDIHYELVEDNMEKKKIELEKLNLKLQKQQNSSKPSMREIKKTKKKIQKIKNLLDPLTHTPLFISPVFDKRGKNKKCIGFGCTQAVSSFKYANEEVTKILGRPFSWYDGRKCAPNKLKYQGPKLGIKLADEEIAKNITHNKVSTLRKHYLQEENDDDKFQAVEVFGLLQYAEEKHKFDESKSFSAIEQRKRMLEYPLPEAKRQQLHNASELLQIENNNSQNLIQINEEKENNTRENKRVNNEKNIEKRQMDEFEILTQITQQHVSRDKNLTQISIRTPRKNNSLTQVQINNVSGNSTNIKMILMQQQKFQEALLQQQCNFQQHLIKALTKKL